MRFVCSRGPATPDHSGDQTAEGGFRGCELESRVSRLSRMNVKRVIECESHELPGLLFKQTARLGRDSESPPRVSDHGRTQRGSASTEASCGLLRAGRDKGKRWGVSGNCRNEFSSIRGRRPRLHRTRFVTKVGPESPDESHPVWPRPFAADHDGTLMKAEGGFRDSELGSKISRIAQMNAERVIKREVPRTFRSPVQTKPAKLIPRFIRGFHSPPCNHLTSSVQAREVFSPARITRCVPARRVPAGIVNSTAACRARVRRSPPTRSRVGVRTRVSPLR